MPNSAVPAIATVGPETSTANVVLVEREVGNRIPRSESEILPLPESVVHRLNVAPMPEREVTVADAGQLPGKTMNLADAVAIAKTTPPNADRQLQINRAEEASPFRTVSNIEKPVDPIRNSPPIRTEPVKIIATHKVNSGESLSKIAARYYGRGTPSRIDAIFDVNRDRLTSVHAVRVGDELRIPAIPDAGGVAYVDAPNFSAADMFKNRRNERDDEIRFPLPPDLNQGKPRPIDESPIPVKRRSESKYDWYVVKENDTLSRIAKREMGSARYYLKLYEANRDILPDKNTLKPGTKIRIPAEQQLSAAIAGQQSS
jgi:nucleoid-associated protein YgaU